MDEGRAFRTANGFATRSKRPLGRSTTMPATRNSDLRVADKIMPVAAVITALSTLVCCLPLGFAAALGFAGLGLIVEPIRPWLVGLAAGFLAIGLIQSYRSKGACQRRSPMAVAMFWAAAI